MLPILFELPAWNIKIHAYGVMILLACTGALWITAWRARREGLRVDAVYELAAWLFLGGVIGARALFVIQHPETIHTPLDLDPELARRQCLLWMHHGRARRLADLLVAQAIPILGDGRRRRTRPGRRDHCSAGSAASSTAVATGPSAISHSRCRCVTPPAPMPGSRRSRPVSCLRRPLSRCPCIRPSFTPPEPDCSCSQS